MELTGGAQCSDWWPATTRCKCWTSSQGWNAWPETGDQDLLYHSVVGIAVARPLQQWALQDPRRILAETLRKEVAYL